MKRAKEPHDPKLSHALRYQLRDSSGVILSGGTTYGKKSWIDHARFGNQNCIKRVKSALDMKWSVTTTRLDGDADINRLFENGDTLHIWIIRGYGEKDDPIASRTSNLSIRQQEHNALDTVASMVESGQLERGEALAHLRKRWPNLFPGVPDDEIRDAIENAADAIELGL